MLQWEHYKDPNALRLWIHLLLHANYTPQEKKWGILEAGQLETTIAKLALETGLSIQVVRYNLHRLTLTNTISIHATNKFSVITLVNWALYQSGDEKRANKAASKTAIRQQTNNSKVTNKTDSFLLSKKKEIDKEGKEAFGACEAWNGEPVVPFEAFWSLYPRKEDKLAARKRWEKLRPDAALFERMKATIEAKKQTDEWRKDKGKYIPMPSTWLNRRRWEDETTATDTGRKADLDELF